MIKELNKKGDTTMYVKHLTEIEPGIFIKEDAIDSDDKQVAKHYEKNAIKILDDDKYHYECMARKFAKSPVFDNEFYSVADVAGGHPKLASFMKISGEITVYDQYASMYKKLHKEFEARYPIGVQVKYEKKQVTHPNFTPNAEVAIICHLLEHLELDQIRRLLGNLETDKIVVYGPNVARAPNEKWFHFRPNDHRTFCTIDAMRSLIEEAGFKIKWAVEYHEDYMIYGDK